MTVNDRNLVSFLCSCVFSCREKTRLCAPKISSAVTSQRPTEFGHQHCPRTHECSTRQPEDRSVL